MALSSTRGKFCMKFEDDDSESLANFFNNLINLSIIVALVIGSGCLAMALVGWAAKMFGW
jgi:hypothetical protein